MKKLTPFLLFTACLAAGCANFQPVSGSKGGVTASSDAQADVIQASRKLIALSSLSGKIEADAETPYDQKVEFIAPDRYHVKYRDSSGADVEMIMAGEDTFLRSGDSWNEVPGDTNPTPTFRNSFTDEALKSISDAKYEGEELLDGQPTLLYSYKLLTVIGNFPVTQKIWVSKVSGVPLKCVAEYSSGPIKTLTTMYDSETPVAINLPNQGSGDRSASSNTGR